MNTYHRSFKKDKQHHSLAFLIVSTSIVTTRHPSLLFSISILLRLETSFGTTVTVAKKMSAVRLVRRKFEGIKHQRERDPTVLLAVARCNVYSPPYRKGAKIVHMSCRCVCDQEMDSLNARFGQFVGVY